MCTCRSLLTALVLVCMVWGCSKKDNGANQPNTSVLTVVATYGGSQNDNAKAVIATGDGGYAILGHTQSEDGDVTDKQGTDFDYWLLKFNGQGELQWNKSYGGSSNDRGNDLVQTSDGGYAILGYSESSDGDVSENAGDLDYWLARTDASGILMWQESFGFKGRDEGISLIKTKDTGFLLVGVLDVTASEAQGNTSAKKHAGGDYWAVRLAPDGSLIWSQYFGGTFTDTAYDVIETDEGGFIIVGSSDSVDVDISGNKGSYDFWVVAISGTGQLIWEKNFGGDEIDEAHSIVKSADGNYIIVGDTRSSNNDISFNHGAADVWVIKINPSGELLWEKAYGGTGFDAGRAIVSSQKGGFFGAGSSRSGDGEVSENLGQNDLWAYKINDSGSLLWEETIGGTQIDLGHSVAELDNGTVIIVGESASSDGDIPVNKGFTDILIVSIEN
ncbi:MAG: hypothetical protein HKN31_03015 [Pricia sp.]|nr:hypothetical protein [Pricia sp.]